MLFAVAFDGAWWFEQAVTWLLFGLMVSIIWLGLQLAYQRWQRRRYNNWDLVIIGFDDSPQALYWEDVRRWLASPQGLWMMVKSTVSGVCLVTLRTVDEAQRIGWVRTDMKNRQFIVDFNAIPPDHLVGGKFQTPQPPKEWKYSTTGDPVALHGPSAVAVRR